jgi:hypothetical protein
MDRLNIQMKPYSMKLPLRIILIAGGLIVSGLGLYKCIQAYNVSSILFIVLGLTSIIQGFNPFGSKVLFLIINDSKVEYNFGNIGRPTTILINEIDSISYNDKRLCFDFKLNNGDNKKLFLRMLPHDKRDAVLNMINSISLEKKK